MRRRPSPATLIALVALFVALGGPAQAKRLIDGSDIRSGTITSRQVKDRSLRTRDLSRGTVRALVKTPDNSVTQAKIVDGAVTSAKLGGASVTAAKLAARSVGSVAIVDGSVGGADLANGAVTGAKVADGSLAAPDVARFAEYFAIAVPAIVPGTCWSGEPQGLAPERQGADISRDLVLITPDQHWDDRHLQLTVRNSTVRSRFVLSICNVVTAAAGHPVTTTAGVVGFRYVVLDMP